MIKGTNEKLIQVAYLQVEVRNLQIRTNVWNFSSTTSISVPWREEAQDNNIRRRWVVFTVEQAQRGWRGIAVLVL